MSFFRPFFFLLVDSLPLLSPVPLCVPVCAAEPSVLAASLGCPAVAGVASAVPVVAAPLVEDSVVGGPLGSGCAAGFSSVPSVVGATFSAPPPVVPPEPPGVISP